MWEIEKYIRDNGRCPCQDFLDQLNVASELPYVTRAINQLMEHGFNLKRPQAAYLRDDIYELRIKTINRQIRILYFFFERRKIILTNGLIKKSERTAETEIEKAINYRKNYMEQKR